MSAVRSEATRVMVVDQKQMVADRIAAFLQYRGFGAKAAYSSGEALTIAQFWPPDIMLADVSEPGREVVETALGLCTALPDCHLVLMYGEDADVDLLQYYRRQGEEFEMLATPVDPKELVRFLSALPGRKAA